MKTTNMVYLLNTKRKKTTTGDEERRKGMAQIIIEALKVLLLY